jgi:hypothetical protein
MNNPEIIAAIKAAISCLEETREEADEAFHSAQKVYFQLEEIEGKLYDLILAVETSKEAKE